MRYLLAAASNEKKDYFTYSTLKIAAVIQTAAIAVK
jgi:hypothetical protein